MPSAGRDLCACDVDGVATGEVATRVRYAGARIFYWCPDGGEIHTRRRADYGDVLFPERADGWLAILGGMGSAKAAMDSISRYFAVALGRYGITVNTVSPGMSDAG